MLQDGSFEELDALLVDERDRDLIRRIENLYGASQNDKKVVGVIYEAMHIRNVTRFLLHKLNYKVAKAEWVTVFDL